MDSFIIITTKEVAKEIENFFNSSILTYGRSLKLGGIAQGANHCTVQIVPVKLGGSIEPQDIFWLGYYCSDKK